MSEGGYSQSKRLVPKINISDAGAEVFCVRFSPDGKFLAAGMGNGTIRVFNAETGSLAYTLNEGISEALPITSIRFRPVNDKSKTKNVLLAVSADGDVQHWHVTSGRLLHSHKEENNQLFCADFKSNAEQFAAAGKDHVIRIYDEATKTLIQEMDGGIGSIRPGHSNRVFSIKFNPEDENILLSGGWDNTVQIWDIRAGASVRSIFGPHICGDAMDIHGGNILTGSWRSENPLELWDFGSGKLIETVQWNQGRSLKESCMLYAAQFNSNGSLIAAGGSGANEAKVFDRSNGNKIVGTVAGLSRAIFSVDWGIDNSLAIAGGDHSIRICQVENVADKD